MILNINDINFDESMKNDMIHVGPKVILEGDIDKVEKEKTFICCNCKKKVRFMKYFFMNF